MHGIVDYLVVVFLLVSPSIFKLPPVTAAFTYALGGIHLLLTVLTKFELGIFKIIPFRIHGYIELIVAIALAGAAFYFNSIEGSLARNFYFGFALAVFLTWATSDYSAKETIN